MNPVAAVVASRFVGKVVSPGKLLLLSSLIVKPLLKLESPLNNMEGKIVSQAGSCSLRVRYEDTL